MNIISGKYVKFMDRAIEIARNSIASEVPVGCVIVYENRIISESSNYIEKNRNVLNHAEILAINKAMEYLNSKYLNECILFCTLEPCKMCMAAIHLSRVKRVIFGSYAKSCIIENTDIIGGVRETHCNLIIHDFFKTKRNK